jgi:hypothetical protein
MKYNTHFLFLIFLVLVSCDLGDSGNVQQEELSLLNQQKFEIEQMANSIPCTELTICDYVAFGSKPCGGPWTYLAYNTEIDEDLFLNKVASYNAREANYNSKWNIPSDCSVATPPIIVNCVDGECTAIFD